MSLLTGTRAQAVGLSVLSKKLSRLHTACPGIRLFDLQQSKDRKYLMRIVIIKGICQIIQRTIQRHAGSTFIVIWCHTPPYSTVPMRLTGSWRRWTACQSRTAIASPIVNTLSSSTPTASQTSCNDATKRNSFLWLSSISGPATLATSTWAPFACWMEGRCQDTGWKR